MGSNVYSVYITRKIAAACSIRNLTIRDAEKEGDYVSRRVALWLAHRHHATMPLVSIDSIRDLIKSPASFKPKLFQPCMLHRQRISRLAKRLASYRIVLRAFSDAMVPLRRTGLTSQAKGRSKAFRRALINSFSWACYLANYTTSF